MTNKEKNKEKNLKYPISVFRIAKETKDNLVELKGNQSWNLFFVELINCYKKFGRAKNK